MAFLLLSAWTGISVQRHRLTGYHERVTVMVFQPSPGGKLTSISSGARRSVMALPVPLTITALFLVWSSSGVSEETLVTPGLTNECRAKRNLADVPPVPSIVMTTL